MPPPFPDNRIMQTIDLIRFRRVVIAVALSTSFAVIGSGVASAQEPDPSATTTTTAPAPPTTEPAPSTTDPLPPLTEPSTTTTAPAEPVVSTTTAPTTTSPAVTAESPVTVQVALGGVVQIVAGENHSCARLSSGQAKCWGDNLDGQLGDGTKTDRALPVSVKPVSGPGVLKDIVELSAGHDYTCARLKNNQVRCWGENFNGTLGDGTATMRTRPVVVKTSNGNPLGGVGGLGAGGDHTCARLTNGQARCWGSNGNGQLGDGTKTDRFFPVAVRNPSGVGALSQVAQIVAGTHFSCARLSSGQARCWGGSGLLGDGTITDRVLPVTVKNGNGVGALAGIQQITAGYAHACVVLTDRQARCWGSRGIGGALGDGISTVNSVAKTPVVVLDSTGTLALAGIKEVMAGGSHTCAHMGGGGAQCWGENQFGQLGRGTSDASAHPLPGIVKDSGGVNPLGGVKFVASGLYHSCAQFPLGARCWGRGDEAQMGNNTIGAGAKINPLPVQVQA
jgi:alpha-tubulin suppressor-like RCC1 family protein